MFLFRKAQASPQESIFFDLENEEGFWGHYCRDYQLRPPQESFIGWNTRELKRHLVALVRPFSTTEEFLIVFLRNSSVFSISCLSINILFLVAVVSYVLSPLLHGSSNDSYFGEYSGTMVHFIAWAIISFVLLVPSLVIAYLPPEKVKELHVVRLWKDCGNLVILIRTMQLWMMFRNIILLGDRNSNLEQPWKYTFILVLLDTLQTHILSNLPFPWPWVVPFCGILFVEQMLTFVALQPLLEFVYPSIKLQIQFTLFIVWLVLIFASGDFQVFNMQSYYVSLRQQRAAQQKRNFVELICVEIRLPLQYIRNCVDKLLANDLSKEHQLYLSQMLCNMNSINVLVDSVLILMKIDEGRLSFGLPGNVDVAQMLSNILSGPLSSDWVIRNCVDFEVNLSNMIRIDEQGLSVLLRSVLHYASMIIIDKLKISLVAPQKVARISFTYSQSSEISLDNNRQIAPGTFVLNVVFECYESDIDKSTDNNIDSPSTIPDTGATHLFLCRVVSRMIGAYIAVDKESALYISLPCEELPNPVQSRVREAVPPNISDTLQSSKDIHQGVTRKVCIILGNESTEGCVLDILSLSQRILVSKLDNRALNEFISNNDSKKNNSPRSADEDAAVFLDSDVIFASTLSTCEALKKLTFRGRIVLYTTSLSYLDDVVLSSVCDYTLSIPCLEGDANRLLDFILDTSVQREESNSSKPLHLPTNQSSTNPNSHLHKEASSHRFVLSSISISRAVHIFVTTIARQLSAWKFFLIGDFVMLFRDKELSSKFLSHRFDFLPNTVLGLNMFDMQVERNFQLWRTIDPYDVSVFDSWKRFAITLQMISRLYFDLKFQDQGKVELILVLISLVVGRNILYNFGFRYFRNYVYYNVWKLGGLLISFLTIDNVLDFKACIEDAVRANQFNKMEDLFNGNVAAPGIFTMLYLIVPLISLAFASHFPWPSSMIWMLTVKARGIYFIYILATPITDIATTNLMIALYSLFTVGMAVSLFRHEYYLRKYFQVFRKMDYSNYFMDLTISAWTVDIIGPLQRLIEIKEQFVEVVDDRLHAGAISINSSMLTRINNYRYGYTIIGCLTSQLCYRVENKSRNTKQPTSNKPTNRATGLHSFEPKLILNYTFPIEQEVRSIVAAFSGGGIFELCNVNIVYKVDDRLLLIKTDIEAWRTVFTNAVSIALKNIHRKLMKSSRRSDAVQEIYIQVRPLDHVESVPAPSPSAAGDGVDCIDHSTRLKFDDPRLMVVEIFDTGMIYSDVHSMNKEPTKDAERSMESMMADISADVEIDRDIDKAINYGSKLKFIVGFDFCKEIVVGGGYSVNDAVGKASFYRMHDGEFGPASSYSSVQCFTFPYKQHQFTKPLTKNQIVKLFVAPRMKVSTEGEVALLREGQTWLDMRQNPAFNGEYLSSSFQWYGCLESPSTKLLPLPLCSPRMIFIYESSSSGYSRSIKNPTSAYSLCLKAFRRKNWRCFIVSDIHSLKFMSLLKTVQCVVIDNCIYLPSSDKYINSAKNARVAAVLRVIGYRMPIVGLYPALPSNMRPSISSNSNLNELPLDLSTVHFLSKNYRKWRQYKEYDVVIHQPISASMMEQLAILSSDYFLFQLLQVYLWS